MDANFLSPNSMLIQGATMSDFESMISRLLDKKLANIFESIPKQAKRFIQAQGSRRKVACLSCNIRCLDKSRSYKCPSCRGTCVLYG